MLCINETNSTRIELGVIFHNRGLEFCMQFALLDIREAEVVFHIKFCELS